MSKMVKIIILILIFIKPCSGLADDILRNSMLKEIAMVNIEKGIGQVIYDNTKSRKQFSQIAGHNVSSDTLGLTIAELKTDGTVKTNTSKVPGGHLVYITEVNMKIFYEDIIVLIDKKYKKGSCEYNAVLEHEKKHVAVAYMVLDFYAPYIRNEIEKIIKSIEPVVVRTTANSYAVNIRYKDEIHERLQPLLNLVHEQLKKGNAKLDTPENYKKDTAMCSNW